MSTSLQFVTLNLSDSENNTVETAVNELDFQVRDHLRDIDDFSTITDDANTPTVVILPLDENHLEHADHIGGDLVFVRQGNNQVDDAQAFEHEPLSIVHNIDDVDEVRFRLAEAHRAYMKLQGPGEVPDELQLKDRAMGATPVGITIAEHNGKDNPLIYVNEGFEKVTGYPRHEILGRDCRFLQGEDTDREKVDRLREAIDQQTDVTIELLNYRKDGTAFWNRLSISPIRNQQGNVTHFVGIQEDVTVEKEQEKRLRRTEALASIGEMAAGIMHEINNPNAIIKGNARFLIRHWAEIEQALRGNTELDDRLLTVVNEIAGAFDEIETSSLRIERIVNKIKFFARRGPQGYDLDSIKPNPIVRSALESLDIEDSIQFNVDITGEDDKFILGDSLGLKKVVTELINNAVDAVDSEPNPQINLWAEFTDDEYCLRITDNGPGIDETIQEKMFEPFFTTKSDNKHIGLGCSIASAIVDQMNGDIEVESTASGTTVLLHIPREQDVE